MDTETRAALVNELADALEAFNDKNDEFYCHHIDRGVVERYAMPIIDRILADRAVRDPDAAGDDLDEMLDSLGADTWIYRVKRDGFGKWVATIEVVPDDYIVVGKGATRMEAIANAVKFAKEADHEHH